MLVRAFAALVLCVAAAVQAQQPANPAPPSLRLPEGARPLRYAATLVVVPGKEKVQGEIAIDLELARAHPVVWLNAELLTVTRAAASAANTTVRILGDHDQFVGFAFDPPLAAGRHRLTLHYEAEQSRNATRGVFTLEDAGAWYSMTHFEPTSARSVFPCFDEPSYKVPWQLTLEVPKELAALSNTAVAEQAAAAPGMKRVRFRETRALPSYLIAFAVGPWEMVTLGREGQRPTPTRIVVPRGRKPDAAFAAGAYPRLFEHTEQWFGIAHPYEKLDHIAIPLSVGFAMENAGLITYGAPTLLAKPGTASPRFRRIAANIGAHEIAHQWFGNLVSPAWWDDLWLNEAFATWFAEKMVDRWQPDYERGAARIQQRAEAMNEDALRSARRIREPIVDRGDIRNAFDPITYQKGATVIGMFEGWIGEQTFRRGVQQYLRAKADGNATSQDFLEALSKASARPVTAAFSTFLDQNGVPQVTVELACPASGKPVVKLSQRRYSPVGASDGPDQRWQVPVCLRYRAGASTKQVCTLLTEPSASLPLAGGCPAYVFANAGGRGYFLPDHRGDLLDRLKRHRKTLQVAELASLLYDLRELVRAGAVEGSAALDWIRAAAAMPDRHVTLAAIELGEFIRDTLIVDSDRERFGGFVREVFGARARAVGLAPRPGEHDDDQLVRRALISFVAPYEPSLAAEARRLAARWVADRKAVDPGLVDVMLQVATRTGDAGLFDLLLAEARATRDRVDRRNLIVALMASGESALAQRAWGCCSIPASTFERFPTRYGELTTRPCREATRTRFSRQTSMHSKSVCRRTPRRGGHRTPTGCARAKRAPTSKRSGASGSRITPEARASSPRRSRRSDCARNCARSSAKVSRPTSGAAKAIGSGQRLDERHRLGSNHAGKCVQR